MQVVFVLSGWTKESYYHNCMVNHGSKEIIMLKQHRNTVGKKNLRNYCQMILRQIFICDRKIENQAKM